MKDIVVLVDAITIVFEEASKGGAPLSLPIASIEVGHGHSLPNLALRYMQFLIDFTLYPPFQLYAKKLIGSIPPRGPSNPGV